MLFGKLALLALPFLGMGIASPIAVGGDKPIEKRATPLEVVNSLQSAIAGPISTLKTPGIGVTDAASALTDIKSAINQATANLPSATSILLARRDADELALRSLDLAHAELVARQSEDLNVVGEVLAEVIKDILEAVEGLADELKKLPLIGAIIIDIDFGLNTLLLGLQLVLAGVVEILQGLLSGVAGLLQSLGNGLLAGLILG